MALLFPIDWAEPFGLVMIEAMACGTPVIAYRSGSVPEVITEGVSGFIVETIDEAADAVARLDQLSREGCRAAFEDRFTVDRMARDYVTAYEKVIAGTARANPRVPLAVGGADLADSTDTANVVESQGP
jgi:glycosyltransferase involved in cell wall biosynthesis